MDVLLPLLCVVLAWLGGRALARSMRSNGRGILVSMAGGFVCGFLALMGLAMLCDGFGLTGDDGFDWGGLVVGGLFLLPLGIAYSVSSAPATTATPTSSESGSTSPPLAERLSEQREAAKAAVSSPEWKRQVAKARKRGLSGSPPPVHSQSSSSVSRSSRGNLSFSYTAVDGETTIREVSSWRADRTYIKGFCLDRGEERTFRRDRIDYFLSGEELLDEPAPPKPSPAPRASSSPKKPEILFTGFDSAVRLELEDLAWDADMTIRQTVTQNLTYLIAGPRAGSTKLRQAGERGATVLDEEQYRHMIETGELLGY